jgi:hypothetical protein
MNTTKAALFRALDHLVDGQTGSHYGSVWMKHDLKFEEWRLKYAVRCNKKEDSLVYPSKGCSDHIHERKKHYKKGHKLYERCPLPRVLNGKDRAKNA